MIYPDNELYIKIKEDNEEAFEIVFLKYYHGLCAYVHGIIRNKDVSEEIVQETFTRIWENRHNIDISVSFKAYLFKTVHNEGLNYLKKIQIRNQFIINEKQSAAYTELHYPLLENYPIANLITRELEEEIRKAINQLPEECRRVFLLCRYKDLSYKEVAANLGISVNTVKTQMQRAIKNLRTALKEYLPEIISLVMLTAAVYTF